MAISNCITQTICEESLINNIAETNCDNMMFSGMEQTALIMNKADIASVATDPANHRIVTDIKFKTGKKSYFIVNARNNPYQGTNTTIEAGDYKNTFTRTVSLFVPMDGAKASMEILDPLANGKFVVILENQFENDEKDNKYQIYGIDKGLKVTSMTQTKYENNDYWVVELQEAGVPNSGRFFIKNTETVMIESTTATGDGSMTSWTLSFQNAEMQTINYTFTNDDIEATGEDPESGRSNMVEFTASDGNTYRFYFDTMDNNITGDIYIVKTTDEYICDLLKAAL